MLELGTKIKRLSFTSPDAAQPSQAIPAVEKKPSKERDIFPDDPEVINNHLARHKDRIVAEIQALPENKRLDKFIELFINVAMVLDTQFEDNARYNALFSDEVMSLMGSSPLDGAKKAFLEITQKNPYYISNFLDTTYFASAYHIPFLASKAQITPPNKLNATINDMPETYISERNMSAFGFLCCQLSLNYSKKTRANTTSMLSLAIQGAAFGIFEPKERQGRKNIQGLEEILSRFIDPDTGEVDESYRRFPIINYILNAERPEPVNEEEISFVRHEQLQELVRMWQFTTPNLTTLGSLEGTAVPLSRGATLAAKKKAGADVRQLMTPGINEKTGKGQELSPIQSALLQVNHRSTETRFSNHLTEMVKKFAIDQDLVSPQILSSLVSREFVGAALKMIAADPHNQAGSLEASYNAFVGGKLMLQKLLLPNFFSEQSEVQLLFLYYLFQLKSSAFESLQPQLLQAIEKSILPTVQQIIDTNEGIKPRQADVQTVMRQFSDEDYVKAKIHSQQFLAETIPETGFISEQSPLGKEKIQKKIDAVAKMLGGLYTLNQTFDYIKTNEKVSPNVFPIVIGLVATICLTSDVIKIRESTPSSLFWFLLIIYSCLTFINIEMTSLDKNKNIELGQEVRSQALDSVLSKDAEVMAVKQKYQRKKVWNKWCSLVGLCGLTLATASPYIQEILPRNNIISSLAYHALSGTDGESTEVKIGNEANFPEAVDPTFVAFGVNERTVWTENACEAHPLFIGINCSNSSWHLELIPQTEVSSTDQLEKITQQEVQKGNIVRINLEEKDDQIFQVPYGYKPIGVLNNGNTIRATYSSGLQFKVETTDSGKIGVIYQKDETPTLPDFLAPHLDLMPDEEVMRIPEVAGIINKANQLKDQGGTTFDILSFMKQSLSDLGIEYGAQKYDSGAPNHEQELAALFANNPDGSLKNNKWTCNMFSYAIFLMAREVNLDVVPITVKVQDGDTIYGGYKHQNHMLLIYRENDDSIPQLFEATLPFGGEYTQTPDANQNFFDQERREAQQNQMLTYGLGTLLGVIAVAGAAGGAIEHKRKDQLNKHPEKIKQFQEQLKLMNGKQLRAIYILTMTVIGKMELDPEYIEKPDLGVKWQDFTKEGGTFSPDQEHISRVADTFLRNITTDESTINTDAKMKKLDDFISMMSNTHLTKVRQEKISIFMISSFKNFFGRRVASEENRDRLIHSFSQIINVLKKKNDHPGSEQGIALLEGIVEVMSL